MGGSRRFVLCLFLGAVAYVGAGYFLADLPPRGISLNAARTEVRIDADVAAVKSNLTYKCHSWRPRRASVYLPFGPSGDRIEDFRATVAPSSQYQEFKDGVLLELAMAPDTEQSFEFHFKQPLKEKRFVYRFSVSKGWPFPPNLISYELDLPAGPSYRFPAHKVMTKPTKAPGRMLYVLDGQGGDVVVEWD